MIKNDNNDDNKENDKFKIKRNKIKKGNQRINKLKKKMVKLIVAAE